MKEKQNTTTTTKKNKNKERNRQKARKYFPKKEKIFYILMLQKGKEAKGIKEKNKMIYYIYIIYYI